MSTHETVDLPLWDLPLLYEMGHALPYFNRNYFMLKEDMESFRVEHKNIGIYRSAYAYSQVEDIKHATLFADFYMDFDSEDDIELAREDLLFVIWRMHLKTGYNLPIEAFRIYFSGMKGFHLIIPHEYMGIRPSLHLDKLFKWIATGLHMESINETLDLVVYERRRLWRLENSRHQETGLYKIPLQYSEAAELSIEAITSLAKQPRVLKGYPEPTLVPQARRMYVQEAKLLIEEEKKQAERLKNYTKKEGTPFKPGEIPDYVQQILDEGPVKNFRNETVAALTSFFKQQNLSKEDIEIELMQWNQGPEALPVSELKTTIDSIYKRNLTYGKRRLKALAEKDMTHIHFDNIPQREGGLPPWKKTNT